MTFFDIVETTVANAAVINAINDTAEINLPLTSYDVIEDTSFEADHSFSSLRFPDFAADKVGFFLFQKYVVKSPHYSHQKNEILSYSHFVHAVITNFLQKQDFERGYHAKRIFLAYFGRPYSDGDPPTSDEDWLPVVKMSEARLPDGPPPKAPVLKPVASLSEKEFSRSLAKSRSTSRVNTLTRTQRSQILANGNGGKHKRSRTNTHISGVDENQASTGESGGVDGLEGTSPIVGHHNRMMSGSVSRISVGGGSGRSTLDKRRRSVSRSRSRNPRALSNASAAPAAHRPRELSRSTTLPHAPQVPPPVGSVGPAGGVSTAHVNSHAHASSYRSLNSHKLKDPRGQGINRVQTASSAYSSNNGGGGPQELSVSLAADKMELSRSAPSSPIMTSPVNEDSIAEPISPPASPRQMSPSVSARCSPRSRSRSPSGSFVVRSSPPNTGGGNGTLSVMSGGGIKGSFQELTDEHGNPRSSVLSDGIDDEMKESSICHTRQDSNIGGVGSYITPPSSQRASIFFPNLEDKIELTVLSQPGSECGENEEYCELNSRIYEPFIDFQPDELDVTREEIEKDPKSKHAFDELLREVCKHLNVVLKRFLEDKSRQYKIFVQMKHYAQRDVGPRDFDNFRILGKGAFGAVSMVQKRDTRVFYALKEMNKKQIKSKNSARTCEAEKHALRRANSPFVNNMKYTFHDPKSLFLVLDVCTGGDLSFHLHEADGYRFRESRARFYAAEMVLGLEALHARKILYRDLKPNNVLLDHEGHIRLSDFGLALQLPHKYRWGLAGTPAYWSPECVQRKPQSFTSDWWTWGVTLYQMLTGRRPHCRCRKKSDEWCTFADNPRMHTNAKANGPYTQKIDYKEDYVSKGARDLLEKIFVRDPTKRLGHNGSEEIRNHPWFTDINWAKLAARDVTPPFRPNDRDINAATIAEIGEMDAKKYKNAELTASDEAFYKRWTSVNPRAIEDELLQVLERNERSKYVPAPTTVEKPSSSCCTIL